MASLKAEVFFFKFYHCNLSRANKFAPVSNLILEMALALQVSYHFPNQSNPGSIKTHCDLYFGATW